MATIIGRGVFTIAVIALTVVGVGWNKAALKRMESRGDGQLLANVGLSADQSLPVALTLLSPELKLGEWQEAQITTAPHARVSLSIIVGGSTESKQIEKIVADTNGVANKRFKIDDWRSLGSVRVIATSVSGSALGEATSSFQLLGETTYPVVDEPSYSYPIIP